MPLTSRSEHDLLGYRDVPAIAYYGVHTLRAVENFPITGTKISSYPELINALAAIKQAATLANMELGLLDKLRGDAIISPARRSAPVRCTSISWSMSSRAAPAPLPT